MRILFITSSRIGDAVISCGILERLRLNNPQARITVACGAVAAGLFARLPGLERLIVFEKSAYDTHWLKLWAKLVLNIWDIVVDVRGSGISLFLAAKRRKILAGGRRPGRRYEQLAAGMGFSPAPLPVAWTAPEDEARAAALLGARPVIALGPTANWDGKIWPPERFVALFHALAALVPGVVPAVFAGPGPAERALAAPVLEALPGALDFVGNLTLPEVAACMRRCMIFIGNDSGLMHIAAAAGAPALGLFGRSRADEYAPAGLRTAVAIAPGPPGEAPMEGLTVETVFLAAKGLLCA
ncbi:MAG TPA: glycosyltransferase family 9 protein [Acidocella sp.]|nr:glycosyltransferase family 9 protein [Acidocella sp.]